MANDHGRDLKAAIPGAPNFTYGEFVKSNTAGKHGISNTPSEEHWQCLEKLAVHVLQPLREEFGPLRITSGYRSVELCEKIGSSKNSNHARGQAADIEPFGADVALFRMLEWIHDNLPYRELIAEKFPGGWIHVAYREGGNDKILKLFDDNHNYTRMDIEEIRKLYG